MRRELRQLNADELAVIEPRQLERGDVSGRARQSAKRAIKEIVPDLRGLSEVIEAAAVANANGSGEPADAARSA